jgi:hypothetical protein
MDAGVLDAPLGIAGSVRQDDPEGANDMILANGVEAGTRTTQAPRRTRLRTIFSLAPQSRRTTILGESGLRMWISCVVTSVTRARLFGSGRARASRRMGATRKGASATARTPGMTPRTRSFFVRARVSMPSMPGIPDSRSHASRVLRDAACDGLSQSSATA